MKSTPILTLATVLALGASGVMAQDYSSPGYDAWRAQQQQYQQQQSQYQDQRDAYSDRQDNYQAERADYEARRAKWERDRAAYDARYGPGAYVRANGEWRYDGYRAANDRPGGDGYRPGNDGYRPGNDGYAQGYGPGNDRYRDSPCERKRSNNTTAGGVIGALAGAAIGSNVAARNARTEGAVLGAVVGAAAGASIGRSTAQCDNTGYYYSYNQTYPYNEGQYYRGASSSGRYNYRWYARHGCRLAMAPAYDGRTSDYRYVRVCPDNNRRYRITR
jgi:hypothetical protein